MDCDHEYEDAETQLARRSTWTTEVLLARLHIDKMRRSYFAVMPATPFLAAVGSAGGRKAEAACPSVRSCELVGHSPGKSY